MDVSSSDGTLVISAEEKETGDRWRGQVSLPLGCFSLINSPRRSSVSSCL